jgi:hypothetical protein
MQKKNRIKLIEIAKDALTYIKALKDELIAGAGGRKEGEDGKPNPEGEISEASNIEKHANLLIVQGKGKELKAKINEWRNSMINILPEVDRANVKSDLIAED